MAQDGKIEIESWMFRASNEHIALIFSIVLLISAGLIFSTFNLYIVIALLALGLVYIRLQQAQFLGNAIRVHPNQFPEIFKVFKEFAINLRINKAALYIVQNPYPNAYTLGVTSCSVILTSALVEQFDQKELNFTIAHELGHYKAGHTKISSLINPLGQGNIFANLIFGFWQRKTEYSADRCGLILTKDIDSGITSLIKLAIGGKLFKEFNMTGYLAQIKKANTSPVKFSEILINHPLITNRIKAILKFYKEDFQQRG